MDSSGTAAAAFRQEQQPPAFGTPRKPPKRITPQSDEIPTPEKPSELRRQARDATIGPISSLGPGSLATEAEPGQRRRNETGRWLSAAEWGGKFPERFEKLKQSFDALVTSTRLFQMRKQTCTFSNLSSKIKHLTKRSFTLGNLAQLKFILPEAISVERILTHNAATCCMEPDLRVTLLPDVLPNNIRLKTESGYFILSETFNARLEQYFEDHPAEDDVPEHDLPDSFMQSALISKTSTDVAGELFPSINSAAETDIISTEQCVLHSLLPHSFKRRFSKKAASVAESPVQSGTPSVFGSSSSAPMEAEPLLVSSSEQLLLEVSSSNCQEQTAEEEEPVQSNNLAAEKSSATDSTPARFVSTPKLQTPKRCRSKDPDDCDMYPVKKSVKRSLTLDDQIDATKNNVLGITEDLVPLVIDKEAKIMEEDEEIIGSKVKSREQRIACLPKLLNTIFLIFQSVNYSAITKQQFIYKIISSQLDAEDRNEVEEQLKLMLELVPDWIYEEVSFTGDVLVRIDKLVTSESMKRRLAEAS